MAKNRLMFEEDGSSEIHSNPGRIAPDETYEADPVYLDEAESAGRSGRSFRMLVGGGVLLLLLLLVGGGVYYFYQKSRADVTTLPEGKIALDGVRDRYYIPESDLTDALKKGRQQYLQGYRDESRRTFQKILDDSTSEKERSIAHIFLGVMALEEDRPGQAKHNFLSALKLDENSIGALVNLAIVERKLGEPAMAKEYAERARKLAPGDPAVAMILANLFLEQSDPAKAEAVYREGMSKAPDDPMMRYNLALALIRQGKLDEAELELNRLVELSPADPTAPRALAYLGQIAYSRNQPERAVSYYQRAIALAPDDARYHYNLGVILLRMRDDHGALSAFEKALKAGGNDPAVFQALAAAFEKVNQPTLASKALEKALLVNPQSVESLFQLADLYHRQKDLLHAAENYRKIVNITPGDQNTREALLRLGRVYREMERYQDSADILSRASTLAPEDAAVQYELGLTYRKANRFDQAVQVWRKALQNGARLDRKDERLIRMTLGDSYRSKGAYDLAIKEYQIIEGRNREAPVVENDSELDLRMAQLFRELKDAGRSSEYYKKVYEAGSATAEERRQAAKDMAVLYMDNPSRESLDQASSWIYKASRLDQRDASVQLVRAEILMRTESGVDREKAIELLLALTHSELPSELGGKAYALLGDAYYKNGEYRRAIEALETAAEYAPSDGEIRKKKRLAVQALRSGER